MATSVAEEARALLVDYFEAITTGNNYRNTVANVSTAVVHPDMLSEWPHVCVEFGRSRVVPQDQARTVFNEDVDVHVVAFVRSDSEATTDVASIAKLQDAMESMFHDLERCVTQILKTHTFGQNNRWSFNFTDGDLVFERSRYLGNGRNIGIIETSFLLSMRSVDYEFNEFLLDQDGDVITTEDGTRIEV